MVCGCVKFLINGSFSLMNTQFFFSTLHCGEAFSPSSEGTMLFTHFCSRCYVLNHHLVEPFHSISTACST